MRVDSHQVSVPPREEIKNIVPIWPIHTHAAVVWTEQSTKISYTDISEKHQSLSTSAKTSLIFLALPDEHLL